MTSREIRQSFLDFFEGKGHRIVDSAPVIPFGDATLLFTNAGMNQFKDVFLGSGSRNYVRAADTQKCIRVSGKHNDLEEVGVDTYHHTFFEMLGNWSFGDYYKEEAIAWAWELLVGVWKLDVERLHATVYRTDDEAFKIWTKYLPEERIHRFDEKDNFWEMGETGPCGPCSEIHYDRTSDLSGGSLVNAGVPEVIEIWNLVFIQFNRKQDGSLEELTAKHVDTGMGFERIVSVIQNKFSNYDTDIFTPIIKEIEKLSRIQYSEKLDDRNGIAMRVIADHLRTLSFSIADGAIPGNEGRGYVLRRILRRACRYSRNLGFTEPVIYRLLPVLIESMGDYFPELLKNQDTITRIIKAEEDSFLQTLERGLEKFEDFVGSGKILSGKDAFLLYDTFGFPIDLTQLISKERNIELDIDGFESEMALQKERSRQSRKKVNLEAENLQLDFVTEFTGYSELKTETKALWIDGNKIVLEKTPFYIESGGQISDTGIIVLGGINYIITDTMKVGNAVIHISDTDFENLVGETVLAKVDEGRRRNIMRNHSATHLLHEALTQVLGSHIKQAGSLVAPDYLRFDFNHFEKVNRDEISRIEKIVNQKIFDSIDVSTNVMSIEDAKKNQKTKMFFGDKYGDFVRVVTIDEKFSMEFCGGTHVRNTSEIGLFKITSESSIAAGVRRIEAISAPAMEAYIDDLYNQIRAGVEQQENLNDRIRQLEKEINKARSEQFGNQIDDLISTAVMVDDIKLVTKLIEAENIDQLRSSGENLRNSLGKSGVGLLAAIIEGKVQLVCVSTDDIMKNLPAGKIVGEAAKLVGGGGGGKPHLATAGGKETERVNEMFAKLPEIVKAFIK
jgi:alanyl-tRNA synthetase